MLYNRELSDEENKKFGQRRYVYCMMYRLIDIFEDEYPRDGLVGIQTFDYIMDFPKDELFNKLVIECGYEKPSYTKFTYDRKLTNEEIEKYNLVWVG